MNARQHDYSPSVSEYELPVNPATPEYHSLVEAVDSKLTPHREITYVTLTPEQQLEAPQHFAYADRTELAAVVADVDVVICISRIENFDVDYTDQYPDRNITLDASAHENVSTSAEVFSMAREANPDVKFISTGRMNNKAIPMMLALPAVAEFAGVNSEDVYHTPQAQFERFVRDAFSVDAYSTRLAELALTDEKLKDDFLNLVQSAVGKDITVPRDTATEDQLKNLADAFIAAYEKYPRVSLSRLMLEEAVEKGVPLDAIYEEDGAVDTITNILNIAAMLEQAGERSDDTDEKRQHPEDIRHSEGLIGVKKVAIVAGSDHLPRTMWIANHVLPDDIEMVFVESNAALSEGAYAESCKREERSFGMGSKWIGGTRDLAELERITNAGYFERFSPEKIAAEVAAVALKNTNN